MKLLSFGGLGLVVAVLVAATLVGSLCGQTFATEHFYHSTWFITLWALLATTGIAYIVRTKRRGSLILLHASLAMVLLGALVTFLTARHGDITLAKDGAPASMFEMRDGTLQKLPFRLQLVDIDTIYSKNGSPSDYRAHITADDRMERSVEYTASLNSPMKIKGYSFCIKGMSDGNLSLLAAHDPFGRPISYTGYVMVCISFLLLFFDKKSGFNTLLQNLKGWRLPKNPAKKKGSDASLIHLVNKLLGLLLCILVLMCLLWYKRDVFPATNGVEALMLLAVFVALLAVALRSKKEFALLRRVLVVVASGIAVAAGVCGFDGNGDVQPILRTPLLGIHVTTIIIAYALLACTAVNAVEKRTTGIAWTSVTLPCHNAACRRYIHWCRVGKHIVGTLLGLGPQGGVGTDNPACMLHWIPRTVTAFHCKAKGFPHFLHCGLRRRAVHILWSELAAWRPAQLYVIHTPRQDRR